LRLDENDKEKGGAMKAGVRKAYLAGAAAVLLAVAASAGNDPWQSKSWKDWTEKDIQKITTDSPWVQRVMVEQTWRAFDDAQLTGAGVSNSSQSGGAGGTGTVLPAEHENVPTRGESVPFLVFWMSSHTMRGAMARRAVIQGNKDPKEASEYVNAPEQNYALLVQGGEMSPFKAKSEKEYMSLAWLQLKKEKNKIEPVKVEYNRDAQGTLSGVFFFFPKKDASGAPTIPPGAKGVEFSCKVGASTIHVTFEPSKMVAQSGVDL
jgi:hypothetical protein